MSERLSSLLTTAMYFSPDVFGDGEALVLTFVDISAYDVTFRFDAVVLEQIFTPTKNATFSMFIEIIAAILTNDSIKDIGCLCFPGEMC